MSLATTARPYGPPWYRMGSVTAPEGGNLVLCIAGLLGGRSPSLHPEWVPAGSCCGKDNPMGQNRCWCLCCFYCFIISQVKKREGLQLWLQSVNLPVLRVSALAESSKLHRSHLSQPHLIAHTQSSQITDTLLFFVPSFTNSTALLQ